jgi:telomere length regulation protein
MYNDGLSDRLAASVEKTRFLGMIVGESISRKLDTEERRLKFKVPDTESPAAESWRSLIDVDDEIHPLKDLQGGIIEETTETPVEPDMVPAEEFLVDDDEDEDADLKLYPAPDSDAEDSDDDPTLVNREKTPNSLSVPLRALTYTRYIRDLMKYLQANDYTKVNVGLRTAPNLIRQKASFGTELSDQAHELARILVGLQDTYEMEQFQDLRHAALIALVASSPEVVVSYLISLYFTGDISIQQRLVLLSALGVGARELAGYGKIVYPH